MVDMHGHATDRITLRTSNALLSAYRSYVIQAPVHDMASDLREHDRLILCCMPYRRI